MAVISEGMSITAALGGMVSLGGGSLSGSRSGVSSKLSSLSKRGLSMAFRPSTRIKAQEVQWEVGDCAETVSMVTMRKEEALESDRVTELGVATPCEVVQVGEGRRVKIRAGSTVGWISTRTNMNEALIVKRAGRADLLYAMEDFEVGGQHEVKSMVTVRVSEHLDSEMVAELKPGALIRIVQLGATSKRRALIQTDYLEGWISVVTKSGELLIGKVTDNKSDRVGFFGASSTKIKVVLEASRSGDLEVIQRAVEGRGTMIARFSSKFNLNCSDIRGKTPLIYAAAFGNKKVVEYLLAQPEVEVNAMDDTQKTAMHHASKRARKRRENSNDTIQAEVVQLLITAKSFLEARDHNGCTALIFAVGNGDMAVMQTLLESQANVNVKDFDGHTPLDYATNFGHDDLADMLRQRGAIGESTYAAVEDEPAPTLPVTRPSVAPAASQAPTAAPRKVGAASATVSAYSPAKTKLEVSDDEPETVSTAAESDTRSSATPSLCSTATPSVAESLPSPVKVKKSVKKKSVSSKLLVEDTGADDQASGTESAVASVSPKKGKKSMVTSLEGADPPAKKKSSGGAEKAVKKGSAKSKSKATKEKALARGMQEMREAAEISQEGAEVAITVETVKEDVVDEKELARERAKQKLQAVLAEGSIQELTKALEDATDADVPEKDVEPARRRLQELKDRAQAANALLNAIDELDVDRLKEAIKTAKNLGVANDLLQKATNALKVEEPKAQVRLKLKKAEESGDISGLKALVAEAKKVNIADSELVVYKNLLECAESKDKALELLNTAIQKRDVRTLKLAIAEAKLVGVDTSEGEDVLKQEEPKQKARDELAKALEASTIEALTKALEKAKNIGLQPAELAEAEEQLERELQKEKLIAGIQQLLADLKTVSMTNMSALAAAKQNLSTAIQDAKEAGVPENALVEAELRRRKIHNGIEDLKGSIRVFCRVRPLSSKEVKANDTVITTAVDAMTVEVDGAKFGFDAVFTPGTQEEVFEDCRDLVQSAADGYNVTMFAYGQTGAGKTFTMYGVKGMEGTAPRTINEIFRVTDQGKDRYQYTVMASMCELYRNEIYDLLSKNTSASKGKLQIRMDKTGTVMVEHLTEEECCNASQLTALLERGTEQRTVAATNMNSESSRSHLIFVVKIVSVNRETQEQLRGKVLICDLAGSERLKKSMVKEDMQKEAIEINKSLTALGDVIESLTKGQKQIPYRNHKLTQLMQDSLGGTAKTLMFVNCSPANSNADETLMSLKYATRAKQIKNSSKKKVVAQE
eukprot:TRINITY_DN28068_c0_g1_i2.p1 TRINITY_DN28068_c0_g1~~TRINITY_DN28068_c0_g1_i2.p1  ORF type:complete len:1273 (+),score=350.36 TRINITY_DN28068_c0_g1_i2:78-3896(+)